jgi:hypothetical protein
LESEVNNLLDHNRRAAERLRDLPSSSLYAFAYGDFTLACQ